MHQLSNESTSARCKGNNQPLGTCHRRMQQQSTTTTTTGPAWALWISQCSNTSPYMFSSQSCTNCGIMHYNGARAGPDLVNCGCGSSRLLLLHSSSTSTDAGQDVCTLCLCCFFLSNVANIYWIHFHMSKYSLQFVVWWYTYIGGGGNMDNTINCIYLLSVTLCCRCKFSSD